MKIAVLSTGKHSKMQKTSIPSAQIFSIHNNTVIEKERKILMNESKNYILQWIIEHKINIVYMHDVDDQMKRCLKKLNVFLKTMDEVKEHPLLNKYI